MGRVPFAKLTHTLFGEAEFAQLDGLSNAVAQNRFFRQRNALRNSFDDSENGDWRNAHSAAKSVTKKITFRIFVTAKCAVERFSAQKMRRPNSQSANRKLRIGAECQRKREKRTQRKRRSFGFPKTFVRRNFREHSAQSEGKCQKFRKFIVREAAHRNRRTRRNKKRKCVFETANDRKELSNWTHWENWENWKKWKKREKWEEYNKWKKWKKLEKWKEQTVWVYGTKKQFRDFSQNNSRVFYLQTLWFRHSDKWT